MACADAQIEEAREIVRRALYAADNANQAGEEAVLKMAEALRAEAWKPMIDAPTGPGLYINVRSVTSYRWLPYRPDGARQMRKAGRWQVIDQYGGWTNAEPPAFGEWILHPSMAKAEAA